MGCVGSIDSGCVLTDNVEIAESFFRKINSEMKKNCYKINQKSKLKKSKHRNNLEMERYFKELFKHRPHMARTSSFLSINCIHCTHKHLFACCVYPTDTLHEALEYAEWKMNFDMSTGAIKKKPIAGIPEALAGQFMPKGFPGFSDKYPKHFESRQDVDVIYPNILRRFIRWLNRLCTCTTQAKFKQSSKISKKIRKDLREWDNYLALQKEIINNSILI